MAIDVLKEGAHQIYNNKAVQYRCSVINQSDGEISIYDQGTDVFPCVATALKKTIQFDLDLKNCTVTPKSSGISGFTIIPVLSNCHCDKETMNCDITVGIKGFLVNCPSACHVKVSAKRFNPAEEEKLIATAMAEIGELAEA